MKIAYVFLTFWIKLKISDTYTSAVFERFRLFRAFRLRERKSKIINTQLLRIRFKNVHMVGAFCTTKQRKYSNVGHLGAEYNSQRQMLSYSCTFRA